MAEGLKDSNRREILKKLGIGAAAVVAGPLLPSTASAGKCTFDPKDEAREAPEDRRKVGLKMKFYGAKGADEKSLGLATIVQEVTGLSSCATLVPWSSYAQLVKTEPSIKDSVYPLGIGPDRSTLSLAVTVLDSGQLGVVGVDELMLASAGQAQGRCIISDVNIKA